MATTRTGAPTRTSAPPPGRLTEIPRGLAILYGGDQVTIVPDAIADAFRTGDRLIVLQTSGEVLHVTAAVSNLVDGAVRRAWEAFGELATLPDERIDHFYDCLSTKLADDVIWQRVISANEDDVRRARQRGRSTTRLVAGEQMRARILEGLLLWRRMPSRRQATQEIVQHEGWRAEQVAAGLGVIGFIFEGRPNVFVDATGVLRSGNTAVMRIGSDALGTARALAAEALQPALQQAGLPAGAVGLLESPERAAGWALFSHPGLALAVARGSGPAVTQLGAIARQSGTPASLHGAGGAWMVADATAQPEALASAVFHSLDSKKCNTLNTLCLVESAAGRLAPVALQAVRRRGEQLGHGFKLHVTAGTERHLPAELFTTYVRVLRAGGEVDEPIAEPLSPGALGVEWEWEATPELTITTVPDVDSAIQLFNTYSPRFIASLLSADAGAHERFFRAIDAPFVGNGFTRWVDGQFALRRPELGLSNWQSGRLFARSGILTGDGVFTVRLRAVQIDPDVHV